MKHATIPGPAPMSYLVDEIGIDDVWDRRVVCIDNGCMALAEGSSSWWFGTVDRSTHLYTLRCQLADECNRFDCPHIPAKQALAEIHGRVAMERVNRDA